MTKYIITGVRFKELKDAKVEGVYQTTWMAYLVENNHVIQCTDCAHTAFEWQDDGAAWIGRALDRLPKALTFPEVVNIKELI